jgi:hypothetical protein
MHNLDIAAIVRRLNLKPVVRIEAGTFVAYLEGQEYWLGEVRKGISSGLTRLRKVCGERRLTQEIAS